MLLEKVSNSRTCKDIDIDDYKCVCFPFKELDFIENKKEIEFLMNLALKTINSRTTSEICEKISVKYLKYAAVKEIESSYSIYRIRFIAEQRTGVEFEAFGSVFPTAMQEVYEKENFGIMKTVQMPENLRTHQSMQLLKIIRIDEYSGLLEESALVLKENPSFCIAKFPSNIEELTDESIRGIENLLKVFDIRIAENLTNCAEKCLEFDSVCQNWAFEFFSNPLVLTQP